jgi:O-antigen ligase/tetratricopeptide (TPR) repeat protein
MTGAESGQSSRAELDNALGVGAALLAGMYVVARATSNQFFYYSGEAAFAGLVAILMGLCVGAKSLVSAQPVRLPRNLILIVVLWIALFIWGALRSPNPGLAVPLLADAGVYALMLLCGWVLAARGNSAVLHIAARAMVAMAAVQAFAGIWQYYIDLPRLQADVRMGKEALPMQLQTTRGLARFGGTDVFGTFGNPNSLAAFLVAGIWLLAGLVWDGTRSRRIAGGIFAALMFWALLLTHSKGGLVACALGGWFFAAQRISAAKPALKRPLFFLSAAGVLAILAVLALGYCEKINLGASLVERFGYWKTAFAMWWQRPLEGVGLAGFAENFSFYKIPLGKETREAHNDYLHLLAELGVLGPLLYLALWYFLLRERSQPVHDAQPADIAAASRMDTAMLAGGLVAFLLMFVAFRSYNSAEVFSLLGGVVNEHSVSSTVETLGLPLLFVMVMRTLRSGDSPPSPALWQGVRAAALAILVHELVDFDFRAQAVIGGLLFLAAIGAARNAPASALSPNWREKLILPLLALVLVPIAFWIPMTSGLARSAAENRDEEARGLLKKKPADPRDPNANVEAAQQFLVLRREAAELRRQAVDAAPFDGNAWIDLANAYLALEAAEPAKPLQKDILAALQNAERLRPQASHPKILLGDFYFRNAMRDYQRNGPRASDLDSAHAWYDAAAMRYPLAPGFRLVSGDALLLRGRIAEASAEYLKALETDVIIDDVNVRLSGVFTDGFSAALPRHGHDGDVLSELDRRIAEISHAARPDALRIEAGLQLRRMVALAGMLHEFQRRHALSTERMRQFRVELTRTGERLIGLLATPTERAHAALLHALSFEMVGDLNGKPEAWMRAKKLQDESRASLAGTPVELFDYYFKRFANTNASPEK